MMATVVVLDELELLTGCTVVVDELELLEVVGCTVVVVVGTTDEVLLDVFACTVVVDVGTSDDVLLEVVGCTVVVVVGTCVEVLLEVVGCTVVVVVGSIDVVVLDVVGSKVVVVVEGGTEYTISIYAAKSSGSADSRDAMFWYSLVGPSCCFLMSMPLFRSLARLPLASVVTSMAASQSLPEGRVPEENTLLS